MPTFLVIGAGTTGIGAAVRLTELGIDHLVVDARDQLGGMSGSVTDDAGFTWDLGGHVLHSHFPEFDAAVAASGIALNHVTRNGWVWLRGDGPNSLVPTPIQQQLDEMPADLRPDAPVRHLADYYRNNFGQRLYDTFFEPYNRKMWTLPLEQVDDGWTSLRSGSAVRNVPVLAVAGTVAVPASTFPSPVGGTGALWQAVHDRLMTPGSVRLGTRVVQVDAPARRARRRHQRRLRILYQHSAGHDGTGVDRVVGPGGGAAGQPSARGRHRLPGPATGGTGRQDLAVLPR